MNHVENNQLLILMMLKVWIIYRRQKEGRPVVFVAHGLFCSSADFVVSDPSKGLGMSCFIIF